ncbi:MAG: DUF4013 domain-containing protein [Nanoarchaeota archaeon]|nr:DUF4013 domain-containing protein [Nanoarchaeota archaeon]MBU1855003.1 DUF4013 domain-containing protein [Nanoarchaeota archaeon]
MNNKKDMNDYKEAIKRPFSDWKKLGIGFLLYLIPIVNIITGFFAWGYLLECSHTSMKKKKELPAWENLGNLFTKGLLGLAISLIYALPSIILGIGFMWKLIQKISPITDITEPLQMLNLVKENIGGEIIVLGLVLLITAYITPMALIFFSKKYEFKDSFKINDLLRKVFTWKYFLAWAFLAILGILISIISQGIINLSQETMIIPTIINAFTSIFIGITRYTLLGKTLFLIEK